MQIGTENNQNLGLQNVKGNAKQQFRMFPVKTDYMHVTYKNSVHSSQTAQSVNIRKRNLLMPSRERIGIYC